MILTHNEIRSLIESKQLIIDPLDREAIGPASIDLTLSPEIRIFENIEQSIEMRETMDFKNVTRPMIIEDQYIMKPNQLVLGITVERIQLPDTVAGWLNSRSRFARMGLMVHLTAPFVQPGVKGRQVLEIYNTGPNNLALIPGEKLCQLILEECSSAASYAGHFQDQSL